MEEFYKDLLYLIDQDRIDEYYKEKKAEVAQWVIEYTGSLKRVKEDQRRRLLAYAESMSFSQAGELNAYVQNLTTVSKKDKERLLKYLQQIDWLPQGQNMGVLDGVMVSRIFKRDPIFDLIKEVHEEKMAEQKKQQKQQQGDTE